ncbi:hypothetical protein D881_10605 [Corynebacterium ulcerans NCTC 12077]|nr:hypothetical protein D881_10605 [Corynebacterium ulcerans NCTC 12077]
MGELPYCCGDWYRADHHPRRNLFFFGAITPSMGKRLTAVAPVTPVFDLEAVREQLSTRTQG